MCITSAHVQFKRTLRGTLDALKRSGAPTAGSAPQNVQEAKNPQCHFLVVQEKVAAGCWDSGEDSFDV